MCFRPQISCCGSYTWSPICMFLEGYAAIRLESAAHERRGSSTLAQCFPFEPFSRLGGSANSYGEKQDVLTACLATYKEHALKQTSGHISICDRRSQSCQSYRGPLIMCSSQDARRRCAPPCCTIWV